MLAEAMNEVRKEKKERQAFQVCFGAHLKKFREKKGISGAELARRSFMDMPNITRIEKGRINLSLYAIKKICDALEISIEDFLQGFKY